ncbi:MAG: Bax inhibitor-1/YccA family protein [Candidatus Sericytochromatia bacterium]
MSNIRTMSSELSYSSGMSPAVFTRRVLPIFGLGLFMTGAAAYIGWGLPRFLTLPIFIVEILMIMTSGSWARKENGNLNVGLFLFFTSLSGLTLVPLLKWASLIGGAKLILQAFGVSAVTFGGLAFYGATTKKDFSGLGGFLVAALIGLIVSSIATMLIGGGSLAYLIISCISVVIFSGFVLYDMAMIRTNYSDGDYILAAIALYLDFINLFSDFLRILGILGSSKD